MDSQPQGEHGEMLSIIAAAAQRARRFLSAQRCRDAEDLVVALGDCEQAYEVLLEYEEVLARAEAEAAPGQAPPPRLMALAHRFAHLLLRSRSVRTHIFSPSDERTEKALAWHTYGHNSANPLYGARVAYGFVDMPPRQRVAETLAVARGMFGARGESRTVAGVEIQWTEEEDRRACIGLLLQAWTLAQHHRAGGRELYRELYRLARVVMPERADSALARGHGSGAARNLQLTEERTFGCVILPPGPWSA
jgi:hypothetical protein